jgi:hypothetical protein
VGVGRWLSGEVREYSYVGGAGLDVEVDWWLSGGVREYCGGKDMLVVDKKNRKTAPKS